jgi:hypothetical protein
MMVANDGAAALMDLEVQALGPLVVEGEEEALHLIGGWMFGSGTEKKRCGSNHEAQLCFQNHWAA